MHDHAAHAAHGDSLNRLAFSATVHCLTGCSIGEVLGMVIGTALSLGNAGTIALAVVLAFAFGYLLTMLPLLRAGVAVRTALGLALASDTVSIAIMEIVDNALMLVIPGAMDAGLDEFRFWGSLALSLLVAGVAAFPVVRWLISRGRGHAVVHKYHSRAADSHSAHHQHDGKVYMNQTTMRRRALLNSLATLSGVGLLWPLRGWSQACSPTGSDTLGPFHIAGAPHTIQLAGIDEPGDRLIVTGYVLAPDCRSPLAGALLDIWQADAEGNYHGKENYRLRGHLRADESGAFSFATIVPGRYKLAGGYRPAHIHLIVSHPLHQSVTTQLYFKGDPYLGKQDACRDDCNSNDADRIVELKKSASGRGFASDVRLVLRA